MSPAAAALGTADNATTGGFMRQRFTAATVWATPDTAAAEMQKLMADYPSRIKTLKRVDALDTHSRKSTRCAKLLGHCRIAAQTIHP